ncbi:TPA: thiopurine S-methyltransferase [Vibrio cholerae]|uniref:thiopurine S-methyltransferase n=1 Tax=Vibrio cholerae TaxID=666 RepID=UPI001D97EFEA|nr:thiopurine S-methyltransferase [Vibrio cholerae]EGQ9320037.1 thiopurine S-methyltransferase [Vibrio cholerae]EGQ9646687.1 thiopurine S-methyltransferase [Vibrio cholerae]EJL6330621.1 thiopurine S-methyltransferase [Vibrio cholerae]EJL6639066.1 thiopurine S-methyltransferase [Vibrio cholerae]
MRDPEFWHNKWAANQIGFHLEDVNPLLIRFWSDLAPKRSEKVLVPLCGKSEDLIWLANQHDSVQGVELSQIAVRSFFAEHFYTPTVTRLNAQYELYQFDELTLFTGDFFTAPVESVDLVYDRAALVALPEEMRAEYAQRVLQLLKPGGRILLVSMDYVQTELSGPPFSVPEAEIRTLFMGCEVRRVYQDTSIDPHLNKRTQAGLSRFAEEVWVIEKSE